MAKGYWKTELTGGGVHALDGIDGATVSEGDRAYVAVNGAGLSYVAITATYSEYSPFMISPDTNPGTIRWRLLIDGYEALGGYQRPRFEYVGANEILLGGGAVHIYGVGKVVWTSGISYTWSSLPASSWRYLYVYSDKSQRWHSAFSDSGTPPVYSHSRAGWYDGSKRCIFAVLVDSAGNQRGFQHDGGRLVEFDNSIQNSTVVPTTTFAEYGPLSIPHFARRAEIFMAIRDGVTNTFYCRPNGSTATQGIKLGHVQSGYGVANIKGSVYTGDTGRIDLRAAAAGTNNLTLNTTGFHLPAGM